MRRRKNKTGFSLVELLLAFAIVAIVFAAVVPQFRAIRNSWDGTEAAAAIVQNGRVLTEHITRNLSSAKRITRVSTSGDINGYIEFQDNNDITKSYMFSSGYVVFGNLGSEEQLAGPVDSFQIACYSLSDLANPTTDVNTIRLVQFATNFSNDSALGNDRIFRSEVFIQTNTQAAALQSVIDITVESRNADDVFDYIQDSGYKVIEVDNWQGGSGEINGLLCFNDIVGDANGQVPQDTVISRATIKLWCVNHNNNNDVYFYRMDVPWTETSTWNSIGGGVNPYVNCDAASAVTANFGNSAPSEIELDVTDIVQGWINGDYPNYGFGIVNSSNNNLQFASAEDTSGGSAHTPILEVGYQSSPAVNVGIIGSWMEGTTHTKESGSNRALVFLAHTEPGNNPTLTTVSYGGQTMTPVIDEDSGSGGNRVYVAAFILDEAGIEAASGGSFSLTWSGGTPSEVVCSSVFMQNANQTTLTGDTSSNAVNGDGITSSSLSTSSGDMVIVAVVCNKTGSYILNNGFTEAMELSISSADASDGYKAATGSNETPSATHSPSGRQALIGFVVKAPEELKTFGGETIGSGTILP
ncbi:MAG: DNRLRE domain-containing protein [Phycisphaerae bacterium]|nr:DNRLRE domain-containing protein [Phycisphaerae bacterium]